MSTITDVLAFNQSFVKNKDYEAYQTGRVPHKRMLILTCMDTRLTELLPRAMNIRNGDAMIIKTAGAIVSHPFGSVMRSILVAVYELGVNEIAVVGHHDCGMTGLDCTRIFSRMHNYGLAPDILSTLQNAGIDLPKWLTGFARPEDGIRQSVQTIRNHPLLPRELTVHGLLIDPGTGKLDLLVDGQKAGEQARQL